MNKSVKPLVCVLVVSDLMLANVVKTQCLWWCGRIS